MLEYTIPYVPPSLNQFAGRENIWEYRALKKTLGRAGGDILQAKAKRADSAGNTDADLSLCGQTAQRPGQLFG